MTPADLVGDQRDHASAPTMLFCSESCEKAAVGVETHTGLVFEDFVWTTKFEMCKVDDDDGQYRYLQSR